MSLVRVKNTSGVTVRKKLNKQGDKGTDARYEPNETCGLFTN